MAALSPEPRRAPARLVAIVLLAAGLTTAAALFAAWRLAPPGDASADAGFARDMATHHAQAVEMSFVIRDETSDPELRALAYDIIVTQSTQRGVFMGWLQEWGLPQSSQQPRMAWMPGHDHRHAPEPGAPLMHGMASDASLRQLRESTGVAAEILFLQLMIRHHEGGVIMARAVEGRASRASVIQMARSIDSGQRVEIVLMSEMLAKRDAQPLPSILE